MASLRFPLFFVFLQVILLLSHSYSVKSDDEEDNLLQGINSYRAALNLTALTDNDNAECFADEIADQIKKQPCTNTTGSYTVPGTETQLSNYPDLLAKCHLNITNTKDGAIMPVCVPNLVPSLVLNNYTLTQYSRYLNDSKFTGVGIGSEGNWMVVVLSTSTPEGSFVKATGDDAAAAAAAAALVPEFGLYHLMPLLLGLFLVLLC